MRLHNVRVRLVDFRIVVAVSIIIGVLLRLVLIAQSGWRIDYDEAMMGLLGQHVLRGEWVAFVPAQATLGALEAYPLALSFVIFGVSVVSFRLVSLLIAAGYILTIGWLARRAFDVRVGSIAAALAAIAPPYMLITGLKTWGGTAETIVLGNLLLLIIGKAVNATDTDRSRRIDLALAGLVAGLMFWLAWLSVYYLLPAMVILLWRGRRVLQSGWWIVLIAFAIGSAPFWIVNVRESFPTFALAFMPSPAHPGAFEAVAAHFGNDLIPRLVTGDPSWQTSGPRGELVLVVLYYIGALSLLIWARWGPWRDRAGASLRWMMAIFVIALPIIYLISGFSRNALNPWGIDATGRYVLMLHTALPIGLAALCVAIGRMRVPGAKLIAITIVALVAGLNLLGNLRLNAIKAFDSPYYNRLPDSLSPLIAYLDEQGISHVWTDVGIAQVLMFETNERIIAADYHDAYLAGGLIRFPDALAAVEAASKIAFVVPVLADQSDPPLQRALDAAGVHYTHVRVMPTLAVYVPDRPIDPAEIAQGLGYQY